MRDEPEPFQEINGEVFCLSEYRNAREGALSEPGRMIPSQGW